jgi:hypothetical protein
MGPVLSEPSRRELKMSFERKVLNGTIVLEHGQRLADGTRVDVTVSDIESNPAASAATPS